MIDKIESLEAISIIGEGFEDFREAVVSQTAGTDQLMALQTAFYAGGSVPVFDNVGTRRKRGDCRVAV